MVFWKGIAAAFSTYSAVPMPRFDWDEETPGQALCWFPAVGLACGGALWGWHALCRALDGGELLFSAVAACLPLLITGGIHMDGFMDTVDAISSHQSRERKLEILKDPHLGAFSAIYCGVYLLLCLGLYAGLYRRGAVAAAFPLFVLSRALSGFNALTMPNARGAGMLFSYTERTRRRGTLAGFAVFAALALGGMLWLSPAAGGGGAALALLCVPCYRALARRQFGGVTGDTAGFFLQLCELSALLGAWLGSGAII